MTTMATVMISTVAIATATTPPTMMPTVLVALGLAAGVVSVAALGPTGSAKGAWKHP